MAHVDYETAWLDLSERLTEKPGWGTKELHAVMVEVASAHRLPETFLQKIIRLYGDRVTIQIQTTETDAPVPDASPTVESKHSDPEASTAERSHDERAPAAAGRT